ncbi:hypothetical protein [Gemmatimonas sp.]|jgi:hypothetical protein|uniref:hypothetical protein n=1 Tax=Gemmatimonas sp. TaxID=1962908 RepID=UPI0037BF2D4D
MRALFTNSFTVAFAATVVTLSPVAAQAQVGHLPAASPYEDFKIGQSLSVLGGWLAVKRDLADVAPKASWTAGLRYEIGVGGPASLFARYMASPSERRLLVPTNPKATRQIGTPGATTHLMDAGLDISLTGRKTWRQLMPSVSGGAGLVSDFAAADTGGYRFGTKFAFNYGFSLRYLPRRGPQFRIDATNFLWQYQYPDRYFVRAADTTAILTDTRNREAWRGNWSLSAGVIVPLFR